MIVLALLAALTVAPTPRVFRILCDMHKIAPCDSFYGMSLNAKGRLDTLYVCVMRPDSTLHMVRPAFGGYWQNVQRIWYPLGREGVKVPCARRRK